MPKIMTIDESIAEKERKLDAALRAIDEAEDELKKAFDSMMSAQESALSIFDEKPTLPDIVKQSYQTQKALLDSLREGVNTFSVAVYKAKAARTPCEPFSM